MAATSEAAREKKRQRDRERQRNLRAAERHLRDPEPTNVPSPPQAEREPEREPEQPTFTPTEPRRSGSADGRILAVIGLPRPGNAQLGYPTRSEVIYKRGQRDHTPSYDEWVNLPRESLPTGIRVVVATEDGTTIEAFGLRLWSDAREDKDDITRHVERLAEELNLSENVVKTRVYSTPPEGTVIFVRESADREPE